MATKSSPAAKKATTKTPLQKKAKSTGVEPKRILVSQRTVAKVPKDQTFAMPQEVKDWIDRAQSIMNHQRNQIETLTQENKRLKEWRKWAEHRILRSDHE